MRCTRRASKTWRWRHILPAVHVPIDPRKRTDPLKKRTALPVELQRHGRACRQALVAVGVAWRQSQMGPWSCSPVSLTYSTCIGRLPVQTAVAGAPGSKLKDAPEAMYGGMLAVGPTLGRAEAGWWRVTSSGSSGSLGT